MFMNFMKKMMKNDKVLVALFVVLLVTFVFLYRKKLVENMTEGDKPSEKEDVSKKEPEVAKEEPELAKEEPELAKEEPVTTKEEPVELTKTSNNLNIENQLVVDPPTEKKSEPPKDEMVLCDNSETCPEDHWCYNNMCVGFASKCQEISNEENKKMEEFTNSKIMETALLQPMPSVTTITSGALF